ncbi:MAG: hypothetical protein P4L31_02905 [Candidatus Babeliales bacterium]|nr:hypothetical protein [Candidatus Babeliales bacterium]
MNLLSLLVLLASCSSSLMASRAPEEISQSSSCLASAPDVSHINPQRLQALLKHIKTVKVIKLGDSQYLSGFHYYGHYKNSTIDETHKEYTIVKLKPELWIVIPAGMKQDDFHGGYVAYQGKNYGWKSFFSSSWTEEELKTNIVKMLKELSCVKKSSDDLGDLYTYQFQGEHPVRALVRDIEGRFYTIKTIYPIVQEVSIDQVKEIAENQAKELFQAHYKTPEIIINPIDQAIEQDNVDDILQYLQNTQKGLSPKADRESKLAQLLQKSIAYRKADMVDLMLMLRAPITQQNVDLAFKGSGNSENDYEVVATLLARSSVEPFINESIVNLAKKHPNKKVLQELIKWLVLHEKEALLALLGEYKGDIARYKHKLFESRQEDITKAKQTKEAKKAEAEEAQKTELHEALTDWFIKKNAMPNSALMKKHLDNEQIIKFANKAIAGSFDHVIKDLMSDDDFRLVLLESSDLLQQILNRADSSDLVNLFINEYKKQFGEHFDNKMIEILRAWAISREDAFTNAALKFIVLYPQFASKWLRSNMNYISDEQVLDLLEKIPLLKADDFIILDIQKYKYQKSLAFAQPAPIKKQECAAMPSASMEDSATIKQRTDNEIGKLLAIVDKDDLLKRQYERARQYKPDDVDKALKFIVTQLNEKQSDDAIKVMLMIEFLKIVLNDEKHIGEFWSHDAFQIMIHYGNRDIIPAIMNNFKKNKSYLQNIIERYFNDSSNKQDIMTLKEINRINSDIIFEGMDNCPVNNKRSCMSRILKTIAISLPLIYSGSSLLSDSKLPFEHNNATAVASSSKYLNSPFQTPLQFSPANSFGLTPLHSEAQYMQNALAAAEISYDKAHELIRKKKYEQAIEILEPLHKQVISLDIKKRSTFLLARALNDWGKMFYHGQGVKKNLNTAYKKFSQVENIAQDNPEFANPYALASAKRYLGEMLYHGQGGAKKDPDAAYKKFREIEDIDNSNPGIILPFNFSTQSNYKMVDPIDLAEAKRYVAGMLYHGEGEVKKDLKAAYKKLIEVEDIARAYPGSVDPLNLADTKKYIGEMLYYGNGINQDITSAYEKFVQVENIIQNHPGIVAADRINLATAKRYLGRILYHGQGGIKEDKEAAYKKFGQVEAIAQNNPGIVDLNNLAEVKRYMGQMLYYGQGVRQDIKAAYRKLIEVEGIAQNNPESVAAYTLASAKRILGEILYDGQGGVKKDRKAAYEKFSQVEDIEKNSPGEARPVNLLITKKYLGQMLYYGQVVKQDVKAAYEKFSQAEDIVQKNLKIAYPIALTAVKRYLGQILYHGKGGVKKDPKAACEKFRFIVKAAQNNRKNVEIDDLEIAEKYIHEDCQGNEGPIEENVAVAAPAPSSETK